jgi:hypothetical protein
MLTMSKYRVELGNKMSSAASSNLFVQI